MQDWKETKSKERKNNKHNTMKIKKQETLETIFEAEVAGVCMHLDGRGIIVSVRLEDQANDEDVEDFLIDWSDVNDWAMASCQKEGDCESLCKRLRQLADNLQAWEDWEQ